MHLEAVVDAHAAAFIGHTPWEVAHDEALLADAHRTAWACYRHRTIMVGIDPACLEAEAWGAAVRPADEDEGVFEIAEYIAPDLESAAKLPHLDPSRHARLQTVFGATRRLLAAVPATVAVPVAGPMALAEAMVGRDRVHAELAADPAAARDRLLALVGKLRPWLHAIGRCGAQAAIAEATYDPHALPPARFAECVQPALRRLVQLIQLETSFTPVLTMNGDTAPIAQGLGESGAGLVNCPDETNPMEFLENLRGFPDLTVQVDLPPGHWTNGDWPAVCRAIAGATPAARRHDRVTLGTGRLPLRASSVFVVDACHFAASMDPWLDPL